MLSAREAWSQCTRDEMDSAIYARETRWRLQSRTRVAVDLAVYAREMRSSYEKLQDAVIVCPARQGRLQAMNRAVSPNFSTECNEDI